MTYIDQAAAAAVPTMDRFGVKETLVMPPPTPVELDEQLTEFAKVMQQYPGRFGFLGGGSSLNPMIQQAVKAGTVSATLQSQFDQTANAIVQAGAVGFGEMAALHLSFEPAHPFVSAPPDHPLFLRLADIAAQNDISIHLHMQAVVQDMATPDYFMKASALNPPRLTENISGFERLLSHNARAKIVWAHVGWDSTGAMTTDLLKRLMLAHPNLYLQLKIDNPPALFSEHRVLDANGTIRPEWLDLITLFSDRVTLGSDAMYTPTGAGVLTVGIVNIQSLVRQLPANVALKVATQNAMGLYRMK